MPYISDDEYNELKRKANLYDNRRRSITPSMKMTVLEQHGWICYYCKTRLSDSNLSFDHYAPVSKGGKTDVSNIVPACLSCNMEKHNKTGDEFIALRRER